MADPPTDRAARWESRYQANDLPWDSADAEPELLRRLDEIGLSSGGAIDLGCGTGANAVALAARGLAVTACDIAPKAIEMAKQRAEEAGIDGIDFHVADILEALPVGPDSIDLAFDRGCFHSVTPEMRPTFVDRVADALKPGGWWLTLAGNRDDDPKFDRPGPPQLTAAALAAAVEPRFELHDLRRIRFNDDGQPTHLAWSAMLRRR